MALKPVLTTSDTKIKVFTDEPDSLKETLTDSRFEITGNQNEADIFWLIGLGRSDYAHKAIQKGAYLN